MNNITPEFNAGISYVQDLIHNSRVRANMMIVAENWKGLHNILESYHINLMGFIRDRKKFDPSKVNMSKSNCLKLKEWCKEDDKLYHRSLLIWFQHLSDLTHESGLAITEKGGTSNLLDV